VALNISGVVWGLGRSKAGKVIAYMENIAVLLLADHDASDLVGKRVMFVCRYSGKGSLFIAYEWLVINNTEG